MRIISRSEWGARPPSSPPVADTAQELYLHHSVGSGTRDWDGDGDTGDDYMRVMQNWHMDGQGWSDIAYNFAIDPDGLEVYEGRGWNVRPGSQNRHNTHTWSVVIMGDFNRLTPDPALQERIVELVVYGQTQGHLPDVPLLGHRDAPRPGGGTTSCPGANLYHVLPTINEMIGEGDMPLSDSDLEKIGNAVDQRLAGFFGPSWEAQVGDKTRRFVKGVIDSSFQPTVAGTGGKTAEEVLAAVYKGRVGSGLSESDVIAIINDHATVHAE